MGKIRTTSKARKLREAIEYAKPIVATFGTPRQSISIHDYEFIAGLPRASLGDRMVIMMYNRKLKLATYR